MKFTLNNVVYPFLVQWIFLLHTFQDRLIKGPTLYIVSSVVRMLFDANNPNFICRPIDNYDAELILTLVDITR